MGVRLMPAHVDEGAANKAKEANYPCWQRRFVRRYLVVPPTGHAAHGDFLDPLGRARPRRATPERRGRPRNHGRPRPWARGRRIGGDEAAAARIVSRLPRVTLHLPGSTLCSPGCLAWASRPQAPIFSAKQRAPIADGAMQTTCSI